MSDELHLGTPDPFQPRHLGSSAEEMRSMLESLGLGSLEELTEAVVPRAIRATELPDLPTSLGETAALGALSTIAAKNTQRRSLIGMGYAASIVPAVIQRNVLENPGWYTQYTPYQAEIAQGRLEALINFQTLVCELTGLPVANASLLDEATAAAEAMHMCWAAAKRKRSRLLASPDCHPQTLAVLRTRAEPLGIAVEPLENEQDLSEDVFAALIQYPGSSGAIGDHRDLADALHERGAKLIVAADPLALTLLATPESFGADVAIGSTQRLGLPMAGGGPHAGYLAAASDLERLIPGRIAGVSRDANGQVAYRLARQTREQHIRREKATSNICTAQVLPAVLTSMYAVYHGPAGLRAIAERVHRATRALAANLNEQGFALSTGSVFDTLKVRTGDLEEPIWTRAREAGYNLRRFGDGSLGITLDEVTDAAEISELAAVFGDFSDSAAAIDEQVRVEIPATLRRDGDFLGQKVFNCYHTEHEMLRYLHRLQSRDLSLVHSMIPLGSCTMKLNAAAEMIPISWPGFSSIHPFAPADDQLGYSELCSQLETWLGELTGFDAVSLQPNAGSQGELAGLLVIRAHHKARGEAHRDICLIPTSAHGTNPASAVMAGLRVVPVQCDARGDIDLDHLRKVADEHKEELAALMITYPSTHGVFEEHIREVCAAVHENGGQVYLDGANLNAQLGLCRPGDFGADVCHLNLHKTFCIPHGGGGPGMGPICVAQHLAGFLPTHPQAETSNPNAIGPVAAAPWGSPGILPISWMFIAMMGATGLREASRLAILNANYMAKRLAPHYPILYTGSNGFVAHEFILDLRPLKQTAGVTVDDVAKRLMDYGFHAPTMSWPVAGTMMVEPTESESRAELDRFCDAMISIRGEIREIEEGRAESGNNILTNAPHTAQAVTHDDWPHAYSRQRAAFPLPWLAERKFWPPVARVDNTFGDRNLVCACDTVEAYAELFGADPANVPTSR